MDDLYLDNIDEFIHDQNKIVTYKWLSLTLGVHVNQAKQMLYHYLDQKRKESSGSQLHATYLVSGKLTENGSTSHKVAVVREDQLEAVKSKMVVIASVHVYSIQKAVLKDSGPLFNTDYDAVKENLKNCSKHSAIRCAGADPLSSAEILRMEEMAQAMPPASEAQQSASKPALNGHSTHVAKPAAQPPRGIMGMFSAKSTSKSQETDKEVKTEVKEDTAAAEPSKSKPPSKPSAMNNFFGKATTSKAKTPAEKEVKVIKEEAGAPASSPAQEEERTASPAARPEVDIKEEKPRSSEARGKRLKESKSIPSSCKTKRLEVSDSEDEKFESQKKKRRRIKKPQPDSSDDEVIPDSPPSHHVATPSPSPEAHVKKEPDSQSEGTSGVRRRKRRRVLKSRTFLDDEGCMVTEKGYQSESCTDSEGDSGTSSHKRPDPPAALKPATGKKEEDRKSQKKTTATANKGTKQASIMGFFQKK
uniref:DNA polymerase delta subunit 3 n=1 Tax=Lepisosteus oculatus TaxID=7918 RepID=W5M2S8_LEPOC|nr:PREDICTED: DNA polymerase delta subunit 3 [Lepisosteus oculatus]